MVNKSKKGFTLVELLAVIVILAIILVIAVPKVMSIIEDGKKGTLESTAKMIASSAEKAKVQNTVLGKEDAITCDSVAKINKGDYASCSIEFDGNTAKVTIQGSGKFDGLNVCAGTKTTAVASEGSCAPSTVSFADDDWSTIVSAVQRGSYPYEVGDTKIIDLGDLGTHTLRVANTTNCSDEWMEDVTKSQTACGFVLEFADIITTYNMNPAGEYNGTQYDYGTNLGGWPASAMRTYVNETIYNAIPEALRTGIIDTTVVSSYEGGTKTNYTSTDKIYLLSSQEVYGPIVINQFDSSIGTSRQLDYYANNNVSTFNYSGAIKNNGESAGWWWLRSAAYVTDRTFCRVDSGGVWEAGIANNSFGVSPAFRIG